MNTNNIKQYSVYKECCFKPEETPDIFGFYTRLGIEGLELFMDDYISRDKILFSGEEEKNRIIESLKKVNIRRIHCSYWGYPTSFLTKSNFSQLISRFGSAEEVARYYGDLTGSHMFERWAQEYMIAAGINAQAYTFHLIDYAPIDGRWDFTISRSEILQAMVFMLQQFVNILIDAGLMTESSPRIEIENAGWGLEYGVQTAEDYEFLFDQLYDPFDKIRIGWDINHLLHAVGYDRKSKRARFFLTEAEISDKMRELEDNYGNDPEGFADEWIKLNVYSPGMLRKTGSFHLSDCKLKEIEYFRNGRLTGKYYEELMSLTDWMLQEDYGVNIVLSEYDSHEILGRGILAPEKVSKIIRKAIAENPEIVLYHELKNSEDQETALLEQIEKLSLK